MRYKKALLTVGAVGVLGTAGSFGTFAAFTDAVDAPTQTMSTGDIEVTGTFNLPTVDKMVTGDPASAGTVTIKNTGDRAQQVWLDQDGPVGTITPGGAGQSDNLLAENLIVNGSYQVKDAADANVGPLVPLDANSRLWIVNRRGLSPLPAAGSTATDIVPLVLQPNESVVLNSTVNLRERGVTGSDEAVEDTSALDNAMQKLSITQNLYVRAIEANGQAQDDFAPGSAGLPAIPVSTLIQDNGTGVPVGAPSN